MKFSSLLYFLIPALLLLASCKEEDPAYDNWKTYTTSNSSLPNDEVWELVVDDNNMVWMLTSKLSYLTSFDGVAWQNIEIPGAIEPPAQFWASALSLDKENNVWLNLQSNITLKYTANSWVTYNHNGFGIIQSINFDNIGNMWMGTSSGLVKYNGADWMLYNVSNSEIPANEVITLEVDIDNSIWMSVMQSPSDGSGQSGVGHFDGIDDWSIYTKTNSGLPSNSVMNIDIDSNGIKWFGTGSGIAKLVGLDWNVIETPLDDCGCLLKIYIDTFDNKWFCTTNLGLVKYDGISWNTYNISNSGIPSNQVNDVVVDRQGNVFVATSEGLAVFK